MVARQELPWEPAMGWAVSPTIMHAYVAQCKHAAPQTTPSGNCCTQVEREISIHSSMAHPHIVDFYAAFEDAGFIYLIMEYAEGVSARQGIASSRQEQWRSEGDLPSGGDLPLKCPSQTKPSLNPACCFLPLTC